MASGGGGNIKVVVRVRPFNGRELDRKAKCIVAMRDAQTVLTPPLRTDSRNPKSNKAALEGTKTFAFDRSYWSFNRNDSHYAGQDDLHADLGKPLLENAFQGYNNCIFAYGQTGSGKSYSMMGYGEEEGVIPKICRDMFEQIEELQKDKTLNCTVEVSYLEIYNERVRDLLNPSTKGNLKVREHPSTGPYVEDLANLVVRSFVEIEHLMDEGNKARTVAATNMNETSSRSHAVFTLTLTQNRHDIETGMDTEKVAKISLVDLAGSERANSTGATGARLKEGAEINRSLSTLGRVIAALSDMSTSKSKTKGMQVPYRDSVLTWLLKDSLGGNSLTAMIAAISPADINFEETLSTLRYADSAKRIKNHAVVNEDPNARMIRELKEELAQLRSKLAGGASGVTAGGVAEEQYAPDTPLEQQIVSITQVDGSIKKVSKAEIAEQLSQSEKLYQDLNQTWEEKLTKTEKIHKEREAALEELGISIEKGFVGLSTPKKMPHLVNLSDDPLLAECLVYNLKPGTTTVGNMDTATSDSAEIRLNGSKILHDHCTFENVDGIVTVITKDGAAVMVNGQRVDAPKRLRSGNRVILGDFHIFRFNHPQEARQERAEQGNSLLRHCVTADQLGSPAMGAGHGRSESSVSHAWSEVDNGDLGSPREVSPIPYGRHGRDSDWTFARREAVQSILGTDQKMSNLTDDELDVLFDDLQRVRAVRRGGPESMLVDPISREDDSDSNGNHPVREKYFSNGTLDNFSLYTALNMPSTPQQLEEDERLRIVREEMQSQLDKQKEHFQAQLKAAEEGNIEIEEIRAEKVMMEEKLLEAKEELQQQLQEQRDAFHQELVELSSTKVFKTKHKRNGSSQQGLNEQQILLAKQVLAQWRRHRYVSMAAAILQNANALKEAQVMSQQMDRAVVFQFTIADLGHTLGSSYDLVLNGVLAEDDDNLENAAKPCLAVRVIDFNKSVIHLWGLQKLDTRIRMMRQMESYLNKPEYMQHFRLENPFEEQFMPEYTRVGDADIPLAAVFQCRVQDFVVDVYSPYTCSVIGIVRLSLEPSSAEAPPSTLKFNVVMHDLAGFAEREGSDVHAQLFIPGVSEEGGATTTQLNDGFGEEPIRFESVHSMSLPLSAPRDSSLRVSIFAKVTAMHLDKLLSWDDMRDSAASPNGWPGLKRNHSRLAEHEYYIEEKHDVFTRVQILEIGEDGTYQPVEVVQNTTADLGAYQLHQGLQRRVVLQLTHSSGEQMPWQGVYGLRAGQVHLVHSTGSMADLDTAQHDVPLTLVTPPLIRNNADGTTNVKLVGQWDSSVHRSLLLDRPTTEKYRVQLTLKWDVLSSRTAKALVFAYEFGVQIRPRTWFRQTSLLSQLWHNQRVVHSTTGNFVVSLKPAGAKTAGDLWRMNTAEDYVKGEELLDGWAPRGVSLIKDFINVKKRQKRAAELGRARGTLSLVALATPTKGHLDEGGELSEHQQELLRRFVALWQAKSSVPELILNRANTEAPQEGAAFADGNGQTKGSVDGLPVLHAAVEFQRKNPSILKAGWLLSPDPSGERWVRRYVELRRPYLHIYSSDGDELTAINLTNSRIDAEPQVAKLLQRDHLRLEVWAVYATNKAWLLACRTARERGEWIWTIDQAYFGPASRSEGQTPETDDQY